MMGRGIWMRRPRPIREVEGGGGVERCERWRRVMVTELRWRRERDNK